MRRVAALAAFLVAGLAAAAVAQTGGQPATPPPTPAPAAVPAQPEAPKGKPVPDLPIVKKAELEGGLVVEDMKIGEGYEVKTGGAVVAFYHGTLKSTGAKFDSAYERGEPIAFPLSGVIEGWQKGVPGMKVGGIRKLTIPAKMAYGERSPSPDIPANSDLVFVIELVDAIQIEDIKEGTGDEAFGQYVAVTTHSIKDKDGKEVEKADAANPYIWIPGEFQGVNFGMMGMKVGGKRKIIVPKEMNQANPQFPPTSRPVDVPLTIEVEMVALRNLQPRK